MVDLVLKPVAYDETAKAHLAKSAMATGFSPDHYDPEIADGTCRLLGGFMDGQRVLTWAYEVIGHSLWVSALGGDAGFKYAATWLAMVEQWGRTQGCNRMGMNTKRPALKRLYQGQGYEVVFNGQDGLTEFAKVIR